MKTRLAVALIVLAIGFRTPTLGADLPTGDLPKAGLSEAVIALALIIFMKLTVFFTGYMIIRLGYNLILAGVKGEFKF